MKLGGHGITVGMRIEARWPLYTVLPISSAIFWVSYWLLWDVVAHRSSHLKADFERLSPLSRMCFRANCNSALHTYTVVVLLLWVLMSDGSLWSTRLSQHYNPVGYAAMCITLGYFSLSVPWNAWLRFVRREHQVVPLSIFAHHLLVVAGALLYVVTSMAAFYGAVAFACMECSNWFFIPRTVAEMLGWNNDGRLGTINGALLVLSFILLRIGVCTIAAVLFVYDLARFSGDAAEWTCVLLAFALFVAVLALSYVWLHLQVMPGLTAAVRQLLKQRRLAKSQTHIAVKAVAASAAAAPEAGAASSTSARSAIRPGRTSRVLPVSEPV